MASYTRVDWDVEMAAKERRRLLVAGKVRELDITRCYKFHRSTSHVALASRPLSLDLRVNLLQNNHGKAVSVN
jgi:hypothetical protein